MKKQVIQEILDRLPEDFDPEQLMYNLYLRIKLDRAEQALAAGQVLSHEELVRETDKWFEP